MLKTNAEIYSVWLEDTGEINDYYLTKAAAQDLAALYSRDGYPATVYQSRPMTTRGA